MLNIVVPMAGRGSRFVEAGFEIPKPFITIGGKPMIQVVIENITPIQEHRFIFLCLEEHIKKYNFDEKLKEVVPNSIIVTVNKVTEGAACTVLLAENYINNDEPLMIANSDQWVDFDINEYLKFMEGNNLDGLIMTMWADHPKWSYVRLTEKCTITEVVEKEVVSNEATVGIYNYRHGSLFVEAAEKMIKENVRVNGEFYVAPAYNQMIQNGCKLGYYNVGREYDGMWGLGTPEDLKIFVDKNIIN